jgi:hypothetical protein
MTQTRTRPSPHGATGGTGGTGGKPIEQSVIDAWERAIATRLIECVEPVAPGVWHVRSQRAGAEPHIVYQHTAGGWRPQDMRCDCPAGEHGNPICAHWAAVVLRRLLQHTTKTDA